MADRRYALLCDAGDGSLGEVGLRLVRLGIDALYAKSVDEAWLLAAQEGGRIHALLFPPGLDGRDLARLAERIASVPGAWPPTLVAVGEKPDAAGRDRLRAAGVRTGVWQPGNDATLRFVVNEALTLPSELSPRQQPRVPATLLASIRVDGTRNDASIYTLSPRGAFVETPRPLAKGSQVELEIWLPETVLRTQARVVYANAPGDDREPRWPLGMSVVFGDLDRVQETYLQRYVEERAAGFLV